MSTRKKDFLLEGANFHSSLFFATHGQVHQYKINANFLQNQLNKLDS